MILLRLPVYVVLFALWTAVVAVQPVVVQGTQLINSKTKDRLQIIGVDYQPGGSSGFKPGSGNDPLSDGKACLRDAALLQRLGVNTIRVYNVDPSLNHDQCVSIFNAAGIYLILDVNSPLDGENLNRADPENSYNTDYLKRIFSVVEAFKDFPNTLGFFGGNEVINEDGVESVPAYLRAITRDLKDYIAKHATRAIPVGYSAADVRNILEDTWTYLSCEIPNSTTSRADFFGLNSYSWCGDSSYTTSGYDQLVAQFSTTSLPVFFSEYGCNKVVPRIFTEVLALYGPQMTEVLCGGLVYEYSQEPNNYGLVVLNDNDTATIRVDYDNLMSQYNKLDIKLLQSMNASASSVKPVQCKPSLIKTSSFLSEFDIPDIPAGGADLIKKGIPNPNHGKLVPVKDTKVPTIVYDSSGRILKDLSIKILPDDQSNIPGDNTSGAPDGSSTATAPHPSKSGATSRRDRSTIPFLLISLAASALILL